MTTFIYLHGFNSVFDPENDKVKALSSLGTVIGVNYDSFDTYENIRQYLKKELNLLKVNSDEFVLVGTSLGGFWAAEMASEFYLPSVIINPCYDPTNMLAKYVGPVKNYKTGVEREFSLFTPRSYRNFKINELDFWFLPLILLDMADEVIDSSETIRHFTGFELVVYPGGNHRFAHMSESLERIKVYQNICSVTEHLNFE